MDLKHPGNPIYVLGETHDELGGSHWYRLRDTLGANPPEVRKSAPKTMQVVARLIRKGLVRAAHDPSEGGLAVAFAEMAFASPHGLEVDISKVPATTKETPRLLFSESASRFVLEIDKAHKADAEAILEKADVPFAKVGKVMKSPVLRVLAKNPGSRARATVIEKKTQALLKAWRHALPLSEDS